MRRYCRDREMDGLSAEPTRTIEIADVFARPIRRRATAVCREADEITERLVCLVRHPDRSQFTVLSSLASCNALLRFDSTVGIRCCAGTRRTSPFGKIPRATSSGTRSRERIDGVSALVNALSTCAGTSSAVPAFSSNRTTCRVAAIDNRSGRTE